MRYLIFTLLVTSVMVFSNCTVKKDLTGTREATQQEPEIIVAKTPPPPPPPVVEEVPDDIGLYKKPPAPSKIKVKKKRIPEVFQIVEEMPQFPGCEDIGNHAERKQCADAKIFDFISENITYPEEARKEGIQGTVLVQFVVEPSGMLSNITILRGVEGGCGDEAVKVIQLMNEKGIRWIPGKIRGNSVRVQYILPVKFKL